MARNSSKAFETILANCQAHGRRQFVEVADNFPKECRYVLEILGQAYKHDDIAQQRGMSPVSHRTEKARRRLGQKPAGLDALE